MPHFCHIAPTPYLEYFCSSNGVHLILAHLVEEDQHYREWYKSREELKILDNSAFEMFKRGEPMMPESRLCELGKQVNADVIVMSDYPAQPWDRTKEAAQQMAPELINEGFQTFYVPQSDVGDMDGFLQSVEWAATSDLVDFIGLSILGVPNAFGNIEKDNKLQRFLSRWKMMQILDRHNILSKIEQNDKKIHFLGALDGWPGEVEILGKYFLEKVYSWDSSQCVWHGLNGIEYDQSPTKLINGKCDIEVDFNYNQATNIDLIRAKNNIAELETSKTMAIFEWQ